MLVEASAQDDCDVTEVESRCRNIEYRVNGLARSKPDEVQADAKSHHEPDGIDRRLSIRVYTTPEPVCAISLISGGSEPVAGRTWKMEMLRLAQKHMPCEHWPTWQNIP